MILVVRRWRSSPQPLTCVCQCGRLLGPCLGESISTALTGGLIVVYAVVRVEEPERKHLLFLRVLSPPPLAEAEISQQLHEILHGYQ